MGAHTSRALLFRWEESVAEEDEKEEDTAAGSGSPEEGGASAPWSASPAAAACSASRVGEEGGDGRGFFLLEDRSFRRLFFSLCNRNTRRHVRELHHFILTPPSLINILTCPTFTSLSKLGGRAAAGAALRASPSRDAALTLGGVSEAAAQPIAAPAREDAGYVTGVADGAAAAGRS